jgi:lipopolysaccharide export system permease protein
MRILDRYIIKAFLTNYLLALGVMVGMYVLLDLIVHFENFAKGAAPTGTAAALVAGAEPASTQGDASANGSSALGILGDMIDYYSFQSLLIFQQVSGAIPLLAAGFTMVRMTRHHELTAMLASGVSLYRVAAPIVLVSVGFAAMTVVNQESIISQPFVIEKLLRKPDQLNQTTSRADMVNFVRDADNSLLSAHEYDPVKKQLKDVFIVQRDETGTPIGHIVADSATWEVPPGGVREEWVMRGVNEEDDRNEPDVRQRVVIPKLPLRTYSTGMTPAQLDLIFQKKAVDFLSSSQVHELVKFSPDVNKPMLNKIMHLRFTQPLMNLVMLLIGIPFLLTREPNRLVVNMIYCTIVSGLVFVATFVLFQMGGTQMDPLLAAWLPVLIFGPFALVMLDFVHT